MVLTEQKKRSREERAKEERDTGSEGEETRTSEERRRIRRQSERGREGGSGSSTEKGLETANVEDLRICGREERIAVVGKTQLERESENLREAERETSRRECCMSSKEERERVGRT